MLGDLGIDQLGAVRLEARKRAGLVRLHEAAVADHVGGEDSGKLALHLSSPNGRRLAEKRRRIQPR